MEQGWQWQWALVRKNGKDNTTQTRTTVRMVTMMSTNMKKRARRTWLGLDIKPRQGHWCTQPEKAKWRKGAKTNLSRRHRPTQPMCHHNEEWRPWWRFEQCVFVFELVKIGAKNKHPTMNKEQEEGDLYPKL
jgi:hypothetical protein